MHHSSSAIVEQVVRTLRRYNHSAQTNCGQPGSLNKNDRPELNWGGFRRKMMSEINGQHMLDQISNLFKRPILFELDFCFRWLIHSSL